MANTDLFNIRDDILGQMNQLLYLLSFEGWGTSLLSDLIQRMILR
jgi:hypothetical protein